MSATTSSAQGGGLSTAAAHTDDQRIDPFVWRLGFVIVLGSMMSILDTSIVNVALDTLHRRLHSSLSDIQWVITGYMLSLATVIPLTGWAARRIGGKRVYLISLVVFTGGSALCGLAGSTTTLIVFRVLQGVGGGMIMPVGQMIMAEAAGPQRMGRVMSIISVPNMLGPVLGPTIGGLILSGASWRWLFYVNVPIGIAAVVLAVRIIPHVVERGAIRRLDVPGLLLMATGMPALTYGLAEVGNTGSFAAAQVLVPLCAGAVLLAAFVWHCLRTPTPLLDLRLFRRSTYSSASVVTFILGVTVFGSLILMPLYYQQVRHLSTIDTGLLLAPQGIGMVVVMPFAGRFSDRMGGGPLTVLGVAIALVATIPFGLIGAGSSYVWLSVAMMVRGMGIGLSMMPAFVAAFAALERSELPDAAPQLNVIMRVGASIGVAVLTVVLARGLVSHPSTATGMSDAFGTAFWWALGMTVVGLLPSIWLMRAERRARAARASAAGQAHSASKLVGEAGA